MPEVGVQFLDLKVGASGNYVDGEGRACHAPAKAAVTSHDLNRSTTDRVSDVAAEARTIEYCHVVSTDEVPMWAEGTRRRFV